MALPKNPCADLRKKHQRFLETAVIIALLFMIAAFKLVPALHPEKPESEKQDPFISIDDSALPTVHEVPPPPPMPAPALEKPGGDDDLPDVIFEETVIDFNNPVPPPKPPPVVENPVDEPDEIVPFWIIEEKPSIIGGLESIMKRIKYPEIARIAEIEGKVIVRVLIDKKGNPTEIELLKGIGGGCDEEAVKAIAATRFTPGRQLDKPVKVRMTIPIIFRLER